jgi:hypothetical protein
VEIRAQLLPAARFWLLGRNAAERAQKILCGDWIGRPQPIASLDGIKTGGFRASNHPQKMKHCIVTAEGYVR